MRNTDPNTAPVWLGLRNVVISGSTIVYDKELDGVYYTFSKFDGFRESTATKGDVTPRPYGHGSWGGSAFFAERNLELVGDIVAETPEMLEVAIEKLMAAIPLAVPEPLVFTSFGRRQHLKVRQVGKPTLDWKGEGKNEAEFNIQLVALDPRKLSGDGSGPDKRITSIAGRDGSVTMTNAGYGTVPPHILSIAGSNKPRITVDGIEGEHWFDIDLTSGAPLIVDYDKKTITRDGVNVFGVARGDWIDLRDKTNTFKYTAESHGPASTLTVYSYDSYR